jgi:hypothetical protein
LVVLGNQLSIERCPHCSISLPNLSKVWESRTSNYLGKKLRYWAAYLCANCGGIVTAYTIEERGEVREIFPSAFEVDDAIPSPAKEFLSQAIGS